jgi:hypothetical protein
MEHATSKQIEKNEIRKFNEHQMSVQTKKIRGKTKPEEINLKISIISINVNRLNSSVVR